MLPILQHLFYEKQFFLKFEYDHPLSKNLEVYLNMSATPLSVHSLKATFLSLKKNEKTLMGWKLTFLGLYDGFKGTF